MTNTMTATQTLARRVRILALVAVAALMGALLTGHGADSAATRSAPVAPAHRPVKELGEGGLMLAAFNGTASITLALTAVSVALPMPLAGATLPVNSLSFGATYPQSAATNGGTAGVGHPSFTDVALTRTVDAYSQALLRELAQNIRSTAVITVQRPVQTGQTKAETLRLTLANTFVENDSESHTTAGGAESVGLYFSRITVAYTSGTGVTTSWYYDRVSNTTG